MRSRPIYELEDGYYKECKTCLQLLKLEHFPYHESSNSPWRNLCDICVVPCLSTMKDRARLNKLNERDYALTLLSRIGYERDSDIPIYQQFNIKHGFTD